MSKMKINLLLKFSNLYESIGEVAIANRDAYCDKHGYSLVVDDKPFDTSIAYNWMKYDAIERHLPGCDWLMWSDADSFIMNDEIKLEDFVPGDKNIVCSFFKMGNNEGCCKNLYTLHTGNFFIRNCDWSFGFLDRFKNAMHTAIENKEVMMDEYTLTSLYKTIPGYPSRFKLMKIDRLFTVPHIGKLGSDDLPKYSPGDFIIHYVTPLTYDQKTVLAERFYKGCMAIWNKALPRAAELDDYPVFLQSIGGLKNGAAI